MLGVDGDNRVVLQQGHVLDCVTIALYTMCSGVELIGLDANSISITSTDGSTKLESKTNADHDTRLKQSVCN